MKWGNHNVIPDRPAVKIYWSISHSKHTCFFTRLWKCSNCRVMRSCLSGLTLFSILLHKVSLYQSMWKKWKSNSFILISLSSATCYAPASANPAKKVLCLLFVSHSSDHNFFLIFFFFFWKSACQRNMNIKFDHLIFFHRTSNVK